MQILRQTKDFLVISGDDMIALPMVLAGGAGVIQLLDKVFQRIFRDDSFGVKIVR
jgi:4-hydroxy-tetrahydrodipicolinate synthase